ncbi:MAG: head GIN domain-containing protein [Pseudomonadota bacterium]
MSSGPPTTQQRQVGDFHAIQLRGAADLTITVGAPTALSVTADSTTLGKLTTEVHDGTLVIDHERGWSWIGGGSAKVQLSTQQLDALTIDGAGDVSITGVKGARLDLKLNGAGSLKASGETQDLQASLSGAGDVNLSQLTAVDAEVSVNGAGGLKVTATGTLDATVNGVGSISYAGPPKQVKTQINGVGSIKPAASGG